MKHPTTSSLLLDLAAARDAIAVIDALDLRAISIDELKEVLIPVFRGYKVVAPVFEPGLRLFRARACARPRTLNEVSYPPPHLVALGRVNRTGAPVLYCCTAREAPFFEVRPQPGDNLTVVQWVTTAKLTANHVGYTSPAFKRLGSRREQAGWSSKPAEIPGDAANFEVAHFLADRFTCCVPPAESHRYKVSVAIVKGRPIGSASGRPIGSGDRDHLSGADPRRRGGVSGSANRIHVVVNGHHCDASFFA